MTSLRRLLVSIFVGSVLAIGCAAETDDTPEEGAVDSSSEALGGCYQCSNCVLHADCRQPRLPHGLFTYADKVRIINSHRPRVGCVAIIKTSSSYGHVAYVHGVSGSTVHIDEGNWPSGHCGSRSGTAAALNITGYWCP